MCNEWTKCLTKQDKRVGEKSEPRTPTHSETICHTHGIHSPNILVGAWHRRRNELSRFSHADGHVIFLRGWPRDSTCGRSDDWPPIMPISRCAINQPCVDMQKMNPYLVVATLVGRFDSKNFMITFERTVHANMPLSLGTGWLDEPAHIRPFSWNSIWFL